jgi:hypothetical protein
VGLKNIKDWYPLGIGGPSDQALGARYGKASTNNFASIINANADKLFVKDLGQDYYSSTDQQYFDLSTAVDTTSIATASKDAPIITSIQFLSPLAVLQSAFRQNHNTNTKNQLTVQYLDGRVTGMTFNLASKAINEKQLIMFDSSNLLTNYIAGSMGLAASQQDLGYMDNIITLEYELLLGNAQYYINAGIPNFTYKNAPTNSGRGVATIDYNNVTGAKDTSITVTAGVSSLTVNKNLSSAVKYWQENNNNVQTYPNGKGSATVQYLQFQEHTNSGLNKLASSTDHIEASSAIGTIIARKGERNILSGYGGMTLQAGASGSYYFNANSGSYNNQRKFEYTNSYINTLAQIDVIQGANPTVSKSDSGAVSINTKLTATNTILVSNLLNFNNVLFQLGANDQDLSIINTENRLSIKIYDFAANAAFQQISMQSGSVVQTISGASLMNAMKSAVEQNYIQAAKYANSQSGGDSLIAQYIYSQMKKGDTLIVNAVNSRLGNISSKGINSTFSTGINHLTTASGQVVNKGQNLINSSMRSWITYSGSLDQASSMDFSALSSFATQSKLNVNFKSAHSGVILKSENNALVGVDNFTDIKQFYSPKVNTTYSGISGKIGIAASNKTVNKYYLGNATFASDTQTVTAVGGPTANTTLDLSINNGEMGIDDFGAEIGSNTIYANFNENLLFCQKDQFGALILTSLDSTNQFTIKVNGFENPADGSYNTSAYKGLRIVNSKNTGSTPSVLMSSGLAQLASAQAAYAAANTSASILTIAQQFNARNYMVMHAA